MSLIKIANSITGQDAEVETTLKKCMEDFTSYYKAHVEDFEDRGIDEEELEEYGEEEWQWIALVDLLINHGYCCELDWKCQRDDFVKYISKLQGMETYDLVIEKDWLDEDADVTQWCAVLEEKWKSQGICIGALDIDSDSYVLFPMPEGKLEELILWAEDIEQRIDHGENM